MGLQLKIESVERVPRWQCTVGLQDSHAKHRKRCDARPALSNVERLRLGSPCSFAAPAFSISDQSFTTPCSISVCNHAWIYHCSLQFSSSWLWVCSPEKRPTTSATVQRETWTRWIHQTCVLNKQDGPEHRNLEWYVAFVRPKLDMIVSAHRVLRLLLPPNNTLFCRFLSIQSVESTMQLLHIWDNVY